MTLKKIYASVGLGTYSQVFMTHTIFLIWILNLNFRWNVIYYTKCHNIKLKLNFIFRALKVEGCDLNTFRFAVNKLDSTEDTTGLKIGYLLCLHFYSK